MQIKNYIKKILILAICTILLWTPQLEVLAAEGQTDENVPELAGFVLAAENGHLQLYYSEGKAQIKVRNLKSGHVWDSSLPDAQIPDGITDLQRQEMESLFTMSYSSATQVSSETTECSLENEEYSVQAEKLKNGFAYIIYIPDFDLQIRTEFVLNEYGMEVKVPEDGITENLQSGAKVDELCKELDGLLKEKKNQLNEILENGNVSGQIKKDTKSAIATLGKMQDTLEEITDSFGISAISDDLSEKMDDVYDLILGKAGKKGIYAKLLESDAIDDSLKNGYRQQLQTEQAAKLGLKIKIAQMKEVPSVTLVDLKMLPYFGAADDNQEGYMIYPDGCGALTYFKKEHGNFSSMYQADTYSSLSADLDWEEEKHTYGLSNVAIPYFGVKEGQDAFIAYVAEGKEMSTIRFAPSGYVVPINRIGAGFNYRQTVATTSVNGEWQTSEDAIAYEREKEKYTATVQYRFLENEGADYNGMANSLRNYMTEQGILQKSKMTENDSLPLALDILGGYKDKVLIFDKYVAGTDFEQAEKIIDGFEDIPVLCNYRGVFEEGYDKYPSSYDVASQLGSAGELKGLSEKVRKGGGSMFLESNQLIADYDQSGYTDGDLTIGNQYVILNNSDGTEYLFSPKKLQERNKESILPAMRQYGSAGLMETLMGSFVYADYSKKYATTRTETVEIYKAILQNTKKKLGTVAVEEGNDYTFSQADWLKNIPTDVNGYVYTDEAVPFFMMLVHGYIPYTALADNQFYNSQTQILKAIEYGQIPYYSLTYEDVALGSTGIYASTFSAIYEDMVEIYNQYSEALGNLTGVPIIRHSKDGNIAITEYEDGTKIIVNYGDSRQTVDGVTVEPMSFAKTGEGETKKIEAKEIKITDESKSEGISVYSPLVIWLSVLLFVSIVIFGGVGFFYRHRH